MKEPTPEQWKAYELNQYSSRSLDEIAIEMGVNRQYLDGLLANMRIEWPDLFLGGTDKMALGRTTGGKNRTRMLSYSPAMDEDVAEKY